MTTPFTSSEQHRAECEARYWLDRFPSGGQPWLRRLTNIKERRGQAAAELLRANVRLAYVKRQAAIAAQDAGSG